MNDAPDAPDISLVPTDDEHKLIEAYAGLKRREKELEMTQWIRILDVVAIGPLMIYAGMKAEEELPRWARGALVLFGIMTIGYNGMNYLSARDEVLLMEGE